VEVDSAIPEYAFDEAAIGMTITGLDGRFQRVNRAFAAMVGREQDDLVGVAVRDITHPEDADDDRAGPSGATSAPTARSSGRAWRPS
jgi:PAS domain S-box-containing protein